jgi:hypothetical protein
VFPIYQLNQLELNGGMAGLQQEKKRSNHKARTVPPLRPKKKRKKRQEDKNAIIPKKPCPPAPARKIIHICGVSRMFVVSFDPQDPG